MRPLDVLVGALFAGAMVLLAWRAGALTRSGGFAAFIVGTLTYASGTIGLALVLLAFFVPSIALSRLGRAHKRALVDIGKAGPRDALQVLANGGVATACALAFAFTHDLRWAVAFAGAYAAATADTWATEIGTLARGTPRSILTWRPIATGMSGGITLAGTLAELGGALWIGLVSPVAIWLAFTQFGHALSFSGHAGSMIALGLAALALVPLAGFAGAILDSLLGATVQELRRCDACERTCETNPHTCGNPTRLVRGIPGVSNDVVNLLATATGAALTLWLPALFGLALWSR